MGKKTTAGAVPQTWVSEAATIALTGRLVGIYGLRDQITITVTLDKSSTVERVTD